MFTSEEEIILEQYFPYHNMDVEERDYYLNLLLHTKDISDSAVLISEDSKSTFEIVNMVLKKTPEFITFNGATTNGEENRWVDGIIIKKGNSYAVISNVYRFAELLREDDKDYSVTDKFTFKGDKLYRKTGYASARYFESEFDTYSLDPVEELLKSKLAKEKSKKKLGMTTLIFIGLFLGAFTGIILYYFVPGGYMRDTVLVDGVFYVVGQGFLRLMQMLVVPLVFCSLICGSAAIGDTKTLGKVGVKTIVFYLFTTALAISIALAVGTIVKPGLGLDTAAIQTQDVTVAESTTLTETLLNIIPTNPIGALANGTMLQVIVFALFVGIILAKLGERVEVVSNFFAQFNDIMMEMTNMVMMAAPIGVYCLIARTFSNIGFSGFIPMAKYMLCVLGALAIHCLGSYSALMAIFTRLNPYRFIRKYFPVMSFAFSTATSNATIPMAIETLDEKIGVSKKISSFTIPLGATINMDGTAIMQGVAVCFAAQAFGITLTPTDYLTVIATATLASIGTAGVPSVGLITLSMVFASVGLPVEAIAMIMGIDRILDMARTMVNITGDAMCTVIVANQDGALNRDVFNSK